MNKWRGGMYMWWKIIQPQERRKSCHLRQPGGPWRPYAKWNKRKIHTVGPWKMLGFETPTHVALKNPCITFDSLKPSLIAYCGLYLTNNMNSWWTHILYVTCLKYCILKTVKYKKRKCYENLKRKYIYNTVLYLLIQ